LFLAVHSFRACHSECSEESPIVDKCFLPKLNKCRTELPNDEVSDTTGDDSSTKAGKKIKQILMKD
jgi:hypothetical protein